MNINEQKVVKAREFDLSKMSVLELVENLEAGDKDYKDYLMLTWCIQAAAQRGAQKAFDKDRACS